jgi:CubicO group peptidase (beta-lactamase class C family)
MSIAPVTGPRTEPGGFGVEWNATNGPNGRQYGGTGRGGQSLIVWPELDMIVVSTAGGNAGQLTAFVRAAVKGDQPFLRMSPETLSCATRSSPPAGRPLRVRRSPCRQQRPQSRARSISFRSTLRGSTRSR